MPSLIQPLFDGPLDIIGDVHGEIDTLRSLLGHLGYGDDNLERLSQGKAEYIRVELEAWREITGSSDK